MRISTTGWSPERIEEMKELYISQGWTVVDEAELNIPLSKWKEFYENNKFWFGAFYGIVVANILDFVFRT